MSWKFWERKKKIILCPEVAAKLSLTPQEPNPDSIIKSLSALPPVITAICVPKESICPAKSLLPLSVCQKCGACCAFFPVNFPDVEIDDLINGAGLTEMSLPAGHLLRVMRGTESNSPRCAALEGEVGKKVRCLIYAGRPSTCRNFKRSWEENIGNTLCDRARAVYGMQPFSQY